jgi:hypothetical protein
MRLSPLVFLLTLPLSADGLSDLKTALSKLKGTEAISATAEVQTWSKGTEKNAKPKQGRTVTRIERGPQGLRLGWSGEQVSKALEIRRKKSGDAFEPLSAEEAWRLLNAAEDLLPGLDKAKVISESVDSWQGQPARKLLVGLDPELDDEAREHIKQASRTATIWLAPDGLPYSAETQSDIKGRLLLISFEMHETSKREFRHVGNRLLVVREEKTQRASGMGQGGESRTVTALTLP